MMPDPRTLTPADAAKAAPLASWRNAGRILILLLLLAGVVGVWANRAALDPALITAAISRHPAAPLIFLVVQLAASLLFLPRTVLAAAAGLMFGMWWGILWAALGSVIGAVAGFLLARYVNSGLVDLETLPRFGPLLLRAERGGWRSVAALRLIPIIPHTLANYALGLTRLSLGSYAVGSFLGQLPMTVAYVVLGAAGERAMSGKTGWIEPTLIGLAALTLSIFLPKLAARRG